MLRPEYDPTNVPVQSYDAGIEPAAPHAAVPDPTQPTGQGHSLTVYVIGTPVAQGSKVANRYGHGVRDANAKTLKPWRSEVAGCVEQAMRETGWQTLDEPTEVRIRFYHQRPASHYGTGRNAGKLKPSAPTWKATAPDADKLARAVLDSLTSSRAVRDDSRVARLVVDDLWSNAATGARITIRPLTDSVPVSRSLPVAEAGTDTNPRHPDASVSQGEGSTVAKGCRDITTATGAGEGVLW